MARVFQCDELNCFGVIDPEIYSPLVVIDPDVELHFCNYDCLAEFAKERAERAE